MRLQRHRKRVCAGSWLWKIPCLTGDSNPCPYCAWLFCQMLYQLSYPCPTKYALTMTLWFTASRHTMGYFAVQGDRPFLFGWGGDSIFVFEILWCWSSVLFRVQYTLIFRTWITMAWHSASLSSARCIICIRKKCVWLICVQNVFDFLWNQMSFSFNLSLSLASASTESQLIKSIQNQW